MVTSTRVLASQAEGMCMLQSHMHSENCQPSTLYRAAILTTRGNASNDNSDKRHAVHQGKIRQTAVRSGGCVTQQGKIRQTAV